MSSGILVTETAVNNIRNIQRKMLDLSDLERLTFTRSFQTNLFNDKSDFDDIYTALYAMQISNTRSAHRDKNLSESDLGQIMHFDIMSEINIGERDIKSSFEDTLLNEFAVADLINLRNTVRRLIPLPSELEIIQTGCVYMRFNVLASKDISLDTPEISGLSEEIIRTSPRWASTFKKFRVKSFDLKIA